MRSLLPISALHRFPAQAAQAGVLAAIGNAGAALSRVVCTIQARVLPLLITAARGAAPHDWQAFLQTTTRAFQPG